MLKGTKQTPSFLLPAGKGKEMAGLEDLLHVGFALQGLGRRMREMGGEVASLLLNRNQVNSDCSGFCTLIISFGSATGNGCVLKVVKRAKKRGKAILTSCPLGPDVARRVQISECRMESLKKKYNEIGMQASGFHQSSFCAICNGKYHLFNDSDEEKEPKRHTRTHIISQQNSRARDV